MTSAAHNRGFFRRLRLHHSPYRRECLITDFEKLLHHIREHAEELGITEGQLDEINSVIRRMREALDP